MSQKRDASSKNTGEDEARSSMTKRPKQETPYDLRNPGEGTRSNKNNQEHPRQSSNRDTSSSRPKQRNESFSENRPVRRWDKGGYNLEQDKTWGKHPRSHDNKPQGQPRPGSGRVKVSYYWPDVSKRLDRFTFFWRADSPFSQHHRTSFLLDGQIFNCSEQYYMHQKAVKFGDQYLAKKIMATSDPARQKSIAKGVANFEQEIWDKVSYDIVKKANIAKFSQNEGLLNLLVATRGTELVEASPGDRKWGIGLAADQSDALRKETWRGENQLGRILTEIRDGEFAGYKYGPESIVHAKYYGYIGFWRSSSPFSPKHLAPFSTDQASYISLFHYLMFKCTDFFGKNHLAKKIGDRMIHNIIERIAYSEPINETAWKLKLKSFLIEGNFYKFRDNPNLKALLLNTNGKVLVYQSVNDDIGSGQEESDEVDLASYNWKKKNHLGLILTFLRDEWIKNPDISLTDLLSKDVPFYRQDFEGLPLICEEPPLLLNNLQRPCENTVKDNKKDKKSSIGRGMEDPCQVSVTTASSPAKVVKSSESLHNQEFRETPTLPNNLQKSCESTAKDKNKEKKSIVSRDTKDSHQAPATTVSHPTKIASTESLHNQDFKETISTCTSFITDPTLSNNPQQPSKMTSEDNNKDNESFISKETKKPCQTSMAQVPSDTKVATSSESMDESPNKIAATVPYENRQKHARSKQETPINSDEEEMGTTQGAVENLCTEEANSGTMASEEIQKIKNRKKRERKRNKKIKNQLVLNQAET